MNFSLLWWLLLHHEKKSTLEFPSVLVFKSRRACRERVTVREHTCSHTWDVRPGQLARTRKGVRTRWQVILNVAGDRPTGNGNGRCAPGGCKENGSHLEAAAKVWCSLFSLKREVWKNLLHKNTSTRSTCLVELPDWTHSACWTWSQFQSSAGTHGRSCSTDFFATLLSFLLSI